VVWHDECFNPSVLIILVFAGFSVAGVLFLLAFLNATIRELPWHRVDRVDRRRKMSLTLMLLEGDRGHDRLRDRAA
jgi:hypothetical protein